MKVLAFVLFGLFAAPEPFQTPNGHEGLLDWRLLAFSGAEPVSGLSDSVGGPSAVGRIGPPATSIDPRPTGNAGDALAGNVLAAAQTEIGAPQDVGHEAHPPRITLVEALVFAFLGGIILNLMPCVFPVLSMKALAVARKAGADAREARILGLAYGAGVIVSFLAIAGLMLSLRQAGAQIGWGFQLQSPIVVGGLALLFFAIGLNFCGLFEVGFLQSVGGATTGGGRFGTFMTGVLAVLVASPCTAPFMAAALGAALTLPTLLGLAVFAALGLGMALPFVAISLVPALRRLLPKPGAWMRYLKEFLAFPMLGSAVWLVWVLRGQAGPHAVELVLAGAIVVAMAGLAMGLIQRGGRLAG